MDVPLSRAVRGDDRSAISSITLDVKVLSCSYGAEDPTSRATLGENPLPNNSSHPSVMTDVSSTMAMGLAADLLVASSMETKADDGFVVSNREMESGLALYVDEVVSGSFLDRHNESMMNSPPGPLGLYATRNTELVGRTVTVEARPSEYSRTQSRW